jgi:hypothetical protein
MINMIRHPKELKDKVRILRSEGWSLGKLQKEFDLPKTTIHSWILDIKVTKQQQKLIRIFALQALQEGRQKSQIIRKNKRISKEKEKLAKGIKAIGKLSDKELFIAGIALYWAEGFKNRHEHRLGFCNSDPAMVKFYIHWLEKCLHINKKNLVARLTLNHVYELKTEEIEQYWSQLTGIPLSQFTKPFFQNTKWQKKFNENNYHGVLRIHVRDSLDHLLEMKGWLEGLKQITPG